MDGAISDGLSDRDGWEAVVPIGFLDQLSRTRTRQEVFATYARWTHAIMDCDRVTVAIFEPGFQDLRLMAIEGERALETGARLPVRGSFIGENHLRGVGGFLHHLDRHDYVEAPKLVAAGIHSIANAPISVRDRCFGYLAVGSRDPEGLGPREVTVLSALARCMGSYLLLHEQIVELSDLAMKDSLTRLHNRRHFEESIANAWQAWVARGCPLSLVMIDVDRFKSLNDSFGHPFGDRVLCEIGALIRGEARPQDAVARIGGEEFAVILTDISHKDAIGVAERLRRKVEATPIAHDGSSARVTISLGVASADSDCIGHQALIERADRALYTSKEKGRNRVCAHATGN